MKVFDDVVTLLFNMSGTIGGISMSAAQPFYASSRIYAQTANGTLIPIRVASSSSSSRAAPSGQMSGE